MKKVQSRLKEKDWMEVDYKSIDKFIQDNVDKRPLEYISSSQEWDKEEGNSKAKSRIRNIIVFNEEKKEEVELEF